MGNQNTENNVIYILGRMWLVNIDEYDAKTQREQAKIKRLLTENEVQTRKMRSDQYTLTPRLCSFIATTNDRSPLPSGDGTRRYLCVEVIGKANMSGRIPYRQMFAQPSASCTTPTASTGSPATTRPKSSSTTGNINRSPHQRWSYQNSSSRRTFIVRSTSGRQLTSRRKSPNT